MKKKLSKSAKKYIRKEKSRIRREVLNSEEREKLIRNLYEKPCQSPVSKKTKAQKVLKKNSKKKSSKKKSSKKK
jgi:hypothetical protein